MHVIGNYGKQLIDLPPSLYMLLMPLYMLAGLMVLIHVFGSYLGFRGLAVPRRIGVIISIYESLFYFIMLLVLYGSPITALLIAFALIHWAGAYAYIKGYLGKHSSRTRLRMYGLYEAVELSFILIILLYL
ncbi:MAG: hypothetical protein RXN93_06590 [Thermocladium sp.]